MRYLILSDIHSNDEALAAVLARVRRKKFDRVVVLGDFVGYGANPNQVIDLIRRIGNEKVMIRGKPRQRSCAASSRETFSIPGRSGAARCTTDKLTPRNRKFLETLPLGPVTVDGAFAICHGSPRDEDAYIFTDYDAYLNFRELESKSASSATATSRACSRSSFTESSGSCFGGPGALSAASGPALPDQPGLDRSAPGSQRGRLLRDLRSTAHVVHFDRVPYPAEKARDKSLQGRPAAHPGRSPSSGREEKSVES